MINISREELIPVRSSAVRELLSEYGAFIIPRAVGCEEVKSTSSRARALSTLHAPVRAARKALDVVIGNDNLPRVLRRRPLELPIESVGHLFPGLEQALNHIETVNRDVAALLGRSSVDLTTCLINRSPRVSWFARHQDSIGVVGTGFSLQLSETLWRIDPTHTIPKSKPYSFTTSPGDVVVIRERDPEVSIDSALKLGQGFNQFYQEGSVIHEGLDVDPNLRGSRLSLNFFSVQHREL